MKGNFFQGIGSYWSQFFQDRNVLEAFGTASTEMLSSVYTELSNLVLSLSHEDIPVYDRLKWDILILNASDVEVIDGKYRFPLPAGFNTKGLNRSPVIVSSAVSPKVILNQGYDFTVGDKSIEFTVDPFGISDIPIREAGGDLRITLWCPIADIDTNRIWRNYGHLIKRWRYSTPAYKGFVRGMFHARMFGPIVNRVESGLHLIAGMPVADGRNETVLAIVNDGALSVVRTNLQDYTIPPYAGVRVKVGDALGPFQALTDTIAVVDYLNEPAWWRGRIGALPLDIGISADVDKAFDQYLKYNTFLVKVNYMAFLEALSRDGGSSVVFEKKTVLTYKKISEPAQFALDGSHRLGVVVSQEFLGYAGGASIMAGFLHELKPSYTYAIILFYLAFNIPVPSWLVYSLRLSKYIDWLYPWDVNKLDGSWKLGLSDRLMRLGEFALDGSRVLPETIRGFAYRQLYNGKITVSGLLRKFIQNDQYIYAQLGESKLKVGCGGWKVGKNNFLALSDACLRKQISIDTPPIYDTRVHSHYPLWYPVSPVQIIGTNKLSGLKRLNGSWRLGAPLFPLRLGDFKVVREKSILVELQKTIKKERIVGVGLPRKLARRCKIGDQGLRLGGWKVGSTADGVRLNGVWRVGETKPQFSLEYILSKNIELNNASGCEASTHTRCELAYPAHPAQLRSIHKLRYNRLDGKWKVGAPGMPLKMGDFELGRDTAVPSELSGKIRKEVYCGILKRLTTNNKLGIYEALRLDGSWRVGAYRRVDGTWKLRQGKLLAAPRFRYSVLKIDGDWKLGATKRDVKLNGSWKLSEGHGAYIDITIKITK